MILLMCEIDLAFENLSITKRLFRIMKNYYNDEIRDALLLEKALLLKNPKLTR